MLKAYRELKFIDIGNEYKVDYFKTDNINTGYYL